MKLKDLICNSGAVLLEGTEDTEIEGISNDSRTIRPGYAFLAVKGFAQDGNAYIPAAKAAGAVAIVSCDRHALAICAANFYGNPSRKLKLVDITGTNGKTTTVTLLYHLLSGLGEPCGLLSTIANYVGDECFEAVNTTSDPITINSLMAQMVEKGCKYCFMEVSSIGVEQERIAGLDFDVALFSNLTHDHLDYHKTFAEYLRCKKLFFDTLGKKAVAITNIDEKNGRIMVQNTPARVITYSCRGVADHKCRVLEEGFEGMLLKIDGRECWTRLFGAHNAYNILAIYCAALALGLDAESTLVGISRLQAARGRLEGIVGPKNICAVIDYAHTPDALENVLKTLREVAPKRQLVCLFGCGGDRDRTKRPEMAAIAQKMADRLVITSDNSRTVKTGLNAEGRRKALCIEDREEAIRAALMTAEPGATVLLAGKGHETYQIIGTEKRHFDEREIVEKVFAEMNE